MGLHQPAAPRAAVHASRDPQTRDPHRYGQSHPGTPAGARRTHQTWPPDRRLNGVADPARRPDRSRASPHWPDLETVPDRPGPRHPRGRLRRVLTEYLLHYNTARPHRALGQLAPAQAGTRPPEINLTEHRIRRKQVLGGLTHEYQIAA